MDNFYVFFTIFTKGNNFCDFMIASLALLKMSSNLLRIVLLGEQILSFKSLLILAGEDNT